MFYSYPEAITLRITLEEMGQPQLPTNVTVDNSTAHGLTQGTMIPKKSKATDIRFHWLKCREAQGHLHYSWRRGKITVLDITPNITHPNIIDTCAQNTWHSTPYTNVVAQWDQQHHKTTTLYTKVANMRGCVVLIPPTTGTQFSIVFLVTTQNTK